MIIPCHMSFQHNVNMYTFPAHSKHTYCGIDIAGKLVCLRPEGKPFHRSSCTVAVSNPVTTKFNQLPDQWSADISIDIYHRTRYTLPYGFQCSSDFKYF